jgi:hypothetical protein
MLKLVAALTVVVLTLPLATRCPAAWAPHIVQQTNGKAARIELPGRFQIVTEKYREVFAVPYLVRMPENGRLLMLAGHGTPHTAALLSSSDNGATWSAPRPMRVDAQGKPSMSMQVGLAYLGAGNVLTGGGIMSEDYGETWPKSVSIPLTYEGRNVYGWDPMLVERDPTTGKVTRLTLTGYGVADPSRAHGGAGPYSQGFILFSTDGGQTWTQPAKVPEWLGVNEVALARARNGDLIGACRTDIPAYLPGESLDHYEGLGITMSKDDGLTWSKPTMLYDWGRHHPSMVVMPNGDIVMTYVVRRGYCDTPEGLPQFGIEAIVSRDNGQSWDLDHKYILASWQGKRTGPSAWWPSSQATSTLLLPDGSLLTAFGTGFRSEPPSTVPSPRDIGLVSWRLNDKRLNKDHRIAEAPANSDLRNKFDPAAKPVKNSRKRSSRNLATAAQGAKVISSSADRAAAAVLYDPYLTTNILNLATLPGWIEIRWPTAQRIAEVRIETGDPSAHSVPSGERIMTGYRLEYERNGTWVELVPPTTLELTPQIDRSRSGAILLSHRFTPVKAAALRLTVTASSDTGKRLSSPDKPIVPPEKLETAIGVIEVIRP